MGNLEAITSLAAEQQESEQVGAPAYTCANNDRGTPDMRAMLAEVDLLGIIRADTSEAGHAAGDRIDFHKCPVCGHADCFRYYPATNSWSCFSASNASGYLGGSALEYFKATRMDDDVEAVKWLREQTGHPYKGKHTGEAEPPEDGAKPKLPHWDSVRAVNPPRRAPVLVEGLLRLGHVGMLTGRAKAGKTWAALQLAIAVATGGEWLGHGCASGSVLYIDPEIDRRSLDNRFAAACEALGADPAAVEAHVKKWSLRGAEAASIANVVHDLRLLCSPGDFSLVVIDSASCFVEGDENSSVDVRRFFSRVLQVASVTGAAVLIVHHHGKGFEGDRAVTDLARGSSVWLDAPDLALSLVEILPPSGEPSDYLPPGARALSLECGGIREFTSPEPVHIIFEYPSHRLDAEGITSDWKPRSGQRAGGKRAGEANASKSDVRAGRCVAAVLHAFACGGYPEGMTGGDAAEVVCEALGEVVKTSTLKQYLSASEFVTVEQVSKQRWKAFPKTE